MKRIVLNKRNHILLLLAYMFLWLVIPVHGADDGDQYGIATIRNIMVPMRDGIRLATDVYLPTKNGSVAEGKFPVILKRTPYNKEVRNIFGRSIKDYVPLGYVLVIQDVRGRYASEGVWRFMNDDGSDAYDTAEWIAGQSWSNGKTGMIGVSYDGATQHAAAMAKPDHLTTIIPVDAVANNAAISVRYDGVFRLMWWDWTYKRVLSGSRQMDHPLTRAALTASFQENRKDYLDELPLRSGTTPLRYAPEYEKWLLEALGHGINDDFWKPNNMIDYPEEHKDIPVFLFGGWYDMFVYSTTSTYRALSKTIKGPVYMWIGPWFHNHQEVSYAGEVRFGKDAMVDRFKNRLIWYDHFLKGVDNEVGKTSPFSKKVRIFVMGTGDGHKTEDGRLFHGGYWREEDDWPLERAIETAYYLHENGNLSTKKPSEKESMTSYESDPRNPVPSIGGNSCCSWGEYGPYNQWGGDHISTWEKSIPISARNDVVVFQSEPLSRDIEVTGEIIIKLWASSDALDTDFAGKLIDVYPPSEDYPQGFDMNIVDGITRARFRNSLEEEQLMEPGEMYEFTIQLGPTSNVFKKNHRIRVDISSSNFPRFDINPNTGEPLNGNRRMKVAVNTVYHDQTRSSHIILPIINE